jgi:hypothetical protein
MTVERFHIQVAAPREDGFPGEVEFGHYTIDNDTLTLTDAAGTALKRPTGEVYTRTLAPGENPRSIACVLLRQHRSERPRKGDFNRRLTPLDQGFA